MTKHRVGPKRYKIEPERHSALVSALAEIVVQDKEAAEAVRAAARAFRGIELRRAADGGRTTKLIDWLLSESVIGRGERILLAELLAGEVLPDGRPCIHASEAREYRELIAFANQHKRDLVKHGMRSNEAAETAAETARLDVRSRGKSKNTILRDMQRNSSKVR